MKPKKAWQPALLLQFSKYFHGVVFLAGLIFPQHWQLMIALLMANHLVIFAAGMLPRCRWLGENWTQLPDSATQRREIALTIDDGPNPEVTPQVLAILEAYQVKATFFCIGEQVQKYPELCCELIQRGHAVENHTQRHGHYFSLLIQPHKIRAEIETAQQNLTAMTGIPPQFFRPTAGLRNFLLDAILCRLNLKLASWTRRGFDTRETDATQVLNRLLKNLQAGDILLLHDNHCAKTVAGVPVILEVLPPLLEAIKKAHLTPVTLSHALNSDIQTP